MPNSSAAGSGRAAHGAGHRFRVFIDFDNTISIGDVLDGVIEKFATGNRWQELESDWEAGRIGARECLEGQLLSLRTDWSALTRHLDSVRLDPGIVPLVAVTQSAHVELTIASDNFDLFLAYLLARHGLESVPTLANHLECLGDRYRPSFPFYNSQCPGCAHCKKTHFVPRGTDPRRVIYIGDGRSDLCPARHADVVFAKSSLLKQLRTEGRTCREFENLTAVAHALEALFHENQP